MREEGHYYLCNVITQHMEFQWRLIYGCRFATKCYRVVDKFYWLEFHGCEIGCLFLRISTKFCYGATILFCICFYICNVFLTVLLYFCVCVKYVSGVRWHKMKFIWNQYAIFRIWWNNQDQFIYTIIILYAICVLWVPFHIVAT